MSHKCSINILHVNCQSIVNIIKLNQIENLAKIHNIEIISLNETFLKPTNDLVLENYFILRSDRTHKKGGGVALCIKKNIIGSQILNSDVSLRDNVIGFLTTLQNKEELAIFSFYSSPSEPINEQFFEQAASKYKNLIILGDFNAKASLGTAIPRITKGNA